MTETVLPLNAISTLTVHGLISNQNGEHISIELQRAVPPINLVPPTISRGTYHGVKFEDIPVPPRPDSKLPPPGSLHTHLDLGSLRGGGGTAVICDVVPRGEIQLPPLVSKVAFPIRRASIAREAWFYDELEMIQGAVIPRCYGWFEAKLPEGCSLDPLWSKFNTGKESFGTRYENFKLPRDIEEREFNPKWGDELEKYHSNNNYVSLLLLERLGQHLPLRVPIPESLGEELRDMFDDITDMSVTHKDVRYDNIMHAPEGPGALPTVPSPFQDSSRLYSWRVIDFEPCIKVNRRVKRSEPHIGYLDRIIVNLPDGIIINPGDS